MSKSMSEYEEYKSKIVGDLTEEEKESFLRMLGYEKPVVKEKFCWIKTIKRILWLD